MDRRRFLTGLGLLAAHGLLPRNPGFAGTRPCPAVEYEGALDEVLMVYDQTAAPHLFRQMTTILRHLPDGTRIHVLVSRERAREARRRLLEYGVEPASILASDEGDVPGDWGRDILQLGCGGGTRPLVCAPWNKAARSHDDLRRGVRQLGGLEESGFEVRLLPIAGGSGLWAARREVVAGKGAWRGLWPRAVW